MYLPSTAQGSAVVAAVPHFPLLTAHPIYQVHAGLFMASDQNHPVLIGHIALP
jgi:hypothetical protein